MIEWSSSPWTRSPTLPLTGPGWSPAWRSSLSRPSGCQLQAVAAPLQVQFWDSRFFQTNPLDSTDDQEYHRRYCHDDPSNSGWVTENILIMLDVLDNRCGTYLDCRWISLGGCPWSRGLLVTEEGLDSETALLDADTEFVVEAAGMVGVRQIRLLQTLRIQLVSWNHIQMLLISS